MREITFLIQHYGVLVVFLSVLIDDIGLPLPSYPALLVAGALSVSDTRLIWPIIFAAAAGGVIADAIWYAAGLRFGRHALAFICKMSFSPDSCVRRTESLFARIGPWAMLFAKFIPGLSYVSVALCGVTRVSLPLFLAIDAIGTGIYIAVPVVLGRLFHDAIDAVLVTLMELGEYGVVLVVGTLAVYATTRWINRRLFIRRLKIDRISVEELGRMIDRGLAPLILDVRPAALRFRDGMIPGSIPAHISEISNVLKTYPLDVEVVVYCSCPNEVSAARAAMHLKRAGFKRIRPLLGGIEAWGTAGRPLVLGASS